MRVLLLNQFYPPDPAPTGRYLRDLAVALVGGGHEVQVLCSRRGYDGGARYVPESREEGVLVRRLSATGFGRRGFAGKIADYLSFSLSLLKSLVRIRPRPDLIVSLTTPPYLGLAARAVAGRLGCRHAHWVMDLYPDVLRAHGLMRDRGLAYSALRGLTRAQLRGASAVVALGPVMAERLVAYGGGLRSGSDSRGGPERQGAAFRVSSVPLWSYEELQAWPEGEGNTLRKERGWSAEELVLLYSGNMGLGHRLSEFLGAAEALGASGPRWVFSGGGKRRGEVERFQGRNPWARVELHEYVPSSQLNAHLCAADVHLASLESAWQGVMVPSKLQASFAVGRPVLFVGARENEIARWIGESGGGWIVKENDVEGLMGAVREAGDAAERARRGSAAKAFARAHFDRATNCGKLVGLLSEEMSVDVGT